jgi:hypothetical protein
MAVRKPTTQKFTPEHYRQHRKFLAKKGTAESALHLYQKQYPWAKAQVDQVSIYSSTTSPLKADS